MSTNAIALEHRLWETEQAVTASLGLWALPRAASVRLINISENATYLVEADGFRSVLRVHRPGYHTRKGIEQELAWSRSLREEGGLITPAPVSGTNGEFVQVLGSPNMGKQCFSVMFEFAEGRQPIKDEDLTKQFENLGAIAARTHEHSHKWTAPEPLERVTWDAEGVFGPNAKWGDWRDAPNVTDEIREVLERAEILVQQRLVTFGKGRDRYGLIHGDMRLANLLIDGDRICLIDFDDCGPGWFLYDFAAGISFMEDHPQVPHLRKAWVKGYRSVRSLSATEEREIDTFVMLRRMALLAWIGSHMEAPEPQAMAPHFAAGTSELAKCYLRAFREG